MRSSQFRRGYHHYIVVVVLTLALACLPWVGLGMRAQAQTGLPAPISYTKAVGGSKGVLLEWRSSDVNNLGFNIYRIQRGQRSLVNGQLIAGGVFRGVRHVAPVTEQSYSWFDRAGTADSIYEIESVGLFGELQTLAGIIPTRNESLTRSIADATPQEGSGTQNARSNEQSFPGTTQVTVSSGALEDQWVVASKFGLKIHIKSDGWYRVTQQQMGATGFNPTVDIRNLSLFSDGKEVAIRTSKEVDQFVNGDFIEFYGRGLDTPTADTRIYYLIAGTSRGKRITGETQVAGVRDDSPPPVTPTVPPAPPATTQRFAWLLQFYTGLDRSEPNSAATPNGPQTRHRDVPEVRPTTVDTGRSVVEENKLVSAASEKSGENPAATSIAENPNTGNPKTEDPKTENPKTIETPRQESAVPAKPAPAAKIAGGKKRMRLRKKATRKARNHRSHRHHADADAAAGSPSFETTVLLKERYFDPVTQFRGIYFTSLLNGERENYFGRVLGASVTQVLNAPNPELTADGPARLEFAIQGVLNQVGSNHSINVEFNGAVVGSFTFGPLDYLLRKINIPVTSLLNGANTVRFIKTSTGEACLVDYAQLTYPHAFKADSNSLRFTVRPALTAKIDGFSSSNIRLIDYTDPFAVRIIRPATEATALGYAITAPTSSVQIKGKRLLLAIPDTQFNQPAALSLNQPSTLNLASNGADMVIVAHQSLISSATPLVNLRQGQGMAVSVVDVDDVFDEFSFGAHGPQAIKEFLSRANTSWTKKPKYVIFLGDSSLDPRNYEAVGNFDLVPTKLLDATYNETSSDDWLTDFNNDGIADVPVGRLPARTAAEANIEISKIVNFVPANVPQSALLVADDPTGYYFNFETANDQVEAQLHALVPGMTVQRINKRTDPNAHDNIIAKAFGTQSVPLAPNQGQALVNYSGHGNVNTWTGANIFNTTDAVAAANGNKLPLVLVMNCLNGYFQDPRLDGIAEGFMKAQAGGAIAVFASSGETIPDGQHEMSDLLYQLLYGSPTVPLGDAIKTAKGATNDIDVRRTWIFFGDPSMKIR